MTNSSRCGAGALLSLSRHRAALSFDTALTPVRAPGHREAAAGASGVRPHAPTLRKLPDMARPARRLPPGKAHRKRHADTDRKISASTAATGHPTQNPNTETIGFRQ